MVIILEADGWGREHISLPKILSFIPSLIAILMNSYNYLIFNQLHITN